MELWQFSIILKTLIYNCVFDPSFKERISQDRVKSQRRRDIFLKSLNSKIPENRPHQDTSLFDFFNMTLPPNLKHTGPLSFVNSAYNNNIISSNFINNDTINVKISDGRQNENLILNHNLKVNYSFISARSK